MSAEPNPARRPYRQVRRAEARERTHDRIVKATYQLHATVGPAQTTIAEIARRAGVQRLTVYRHFPDERALFAACGRHSREVNPPPDPAGWAAGDPPAAAEVLLDVYRYYRFNPRLVENIHRDAESGPLVETVRWAMTGMRAMTAAAAERIAASTPHGAEAEATVSAAARHAVSFWAWRSLAIDGGLDDGQVAELLLALIRAAAR